MDFEDFVDLMTPKLLAETAGMIGMKELKDAFKEVGLRNALSYFIIHFPLLSPHIDLTIVFTSSLTWTVTERLRQ